MAIWGMGAIKGPLHHHKEDTNAARKYRTMHSLFYISLSCVFISRSSVSAVISQKREDECCLEIALGRS
jgi:hypothetical protein